MFTIFAVHQGDDDMRSGTPTWFFTSRERAEACALKRGWYQGTAPISEQHVIQIGNVAYELRHKSQISLPALDCGPDEIEALRKSAASKLSDAERKVLGLGANP